MNQQLTSRQQMMLFCIEGFRNTNNPLAEELFKLFCEEFTLSDFYEGGKDRITKKFTRKPPQ